MNKSKRVIIYLLILSAIAAISVFAVMQVKKRAIPLHDDYFIGNTSGNLYNGGYFCEDENGTVYFSNHLDSDALYSMNPDESGCKRIIASGSKDILSCGNYLFYFQHTENNVSQGLGMVVNDYGVFRIRNDGSNNVCLLRGMVSSLQLGGNYLYYQEGNLTEGSLSKIKINETTHLLRVIILIPDATLKEIYTTYLPTTTVCICLMPPLKIRQEALFMKEAFISLLSMVVTYIL